MQKYSLKKYLQYRNRLIGSALKRIPIIRKHYRLRSRIDCITDACNFLFERKTQINSKEFSTSITKNLSRLGIDFSQLPNGSQNDLYLLFANAPMPPEKYNEIKQQMVKVSVNILTCRQWLNLHEMCCFRGRYTLAKIFREKARILSIEPLKKKWLKPPISWENTIGAAIEGGECNQPEHLDQLLVRDHITGDAAIKWHLYLAVLNGYDISEEWIRVFDESDFANYLVGKTIAIVGPAPTEALDAQEIDSHDIVVRLNHSYENKGTDFKNKGLRTDITCFNGEQANAFIKENRAILPKEVSWGCFKNLGKADLVQIKNPDKKNRSHITFQETQFHGSFNMIPIVTLDLALYNYKAIKIYHTDLMLTVSRQTGYYPESFDRDNKMIELFLKGSVNHDPIQQFRILSHLFMNRKIEGDSRFSKVMNMGLEKYLEELEKVYFS